MSNIVNIDSKFMGIFPYFKFFVVGHFKTPFGRLVARCKVQGKIQVASYKVRVKNKIQNTKKDTGYKVQDKKIVFGF